MHEPPEPIAPASLVEAFQSAAAAYPDRTAVKCGMRSLTYAELDRRSTHLARELPTLTRTSERPVGILLDRSVEMAVAALAVLKAGSFYLPLDPEAPAARNAIILEDAAPVAVVTSRSLAERVPAGIERCLVDAPSAAPQAAVPLPERVAPESRAYVIFTSGTTGRPKGVEVTHRNVLRLFSESAAVFGFTSEDVWTVFHSFAFDFSVWEMWGALLHGGCAVFVPADVAKDPASFHRLLRQERVTVLNQTPSAFQQLVTEDGRHQERLPLRFVVFGGEALRFSDLKPWAAKYGVGRPVLVNMYGITETTVHTSYHQVRQSDLHDGDSVIGRPLPDLDLLLVDEELRCVEPGETGEMVVVGPGVALGYLGRPDLTAARFVTVEDPAGRLVRGYRSGDLARLRPDGLLVYLGRADSQVKIRGFRIELGEVEAALAGHPAVRHAAAAVRESATGGATLVGHVVPEPGVEPDVAEIRAHLAEVLPHYMIPSAIGLLEAMPLTGNGKLDRAALPDVVVAPGRSAQAPRSAAEAELCALFAELLEQEEVGPQDDFFELGGHSLLAISLQNRVRAVFQSGHAQPLPLSQVYRSPTPAGIARWLEQAGHELRAADVRPDGGPVPLNPQQSDMLMRHVFAPDDLVHHCAMGWRVEGEVDPEALARAVEHVHRRHEALRSSYRFDADPGPAAVPLDVAPPRPAVLWAPDPEEAHALLRQALGRPFRLEEGEIWRVVMVTIGPGASHLIGLVVHHVAFDGWSESVLAGDLADAYNASRIGRIPPGETGPTLQEVADAQRARLTSETLEQQRAYWRGELTGVPSLTVPEPPADRPADGGPECQVFSLPEETLKRVEERAAELGVTPFVVLLTAYGAALAEVSGDHDIAVGTPFALRGDERLDRAVSCLVDVLCVRMRFSGKGAGRNDPARVADTVRRAFAAQDIPFSEVVRLVNPPRGPRAPLFQNMFALQNNAPAELELSGAATEFFRPAPFGLPTELVAEVRPHERGGPRLTVSYRPHQVPASFAAQLGARFLTLLDDVTAP
ncbi:hypothetical protein C1I97_01290 [Streptomyces sp. NTH33]|uniref:non-ribosomal peptide synthetase n=1 Tax=Streptomyces sp. NTH33 TaxID=1735453 RepID=UPI000DA940ED|nr:non-ribosomal peptide synthetase [Streptomyces sp. NTH33]PZH20312.1 hypothetical protein C1I97_01290 [Streptomyces sp. NTH33]